MSRLFVLLAVSVLALSTGACATIVEGTSQDIAVTTMPGGATCEFERVGSVIALIDATPGTVHVSKSQDSIVVSCTKEGHLSVTEVVSSSFGGATLGNILLGGVVGVVIDASSGANNNYPDTISLALPPENFESAEARDSFFDALSAEADRRGETVMAAANTSALCRKDPEGKECVDLIAEIETARERERAQIETQRSEVIIEPMGEGT
jgi:hypothetical protein